MQNKRNQLSSLPQQALRAMPTPDKLNEQARRDDPSEQVEGVGLETQQHKAD